MLRIAEHIQLSPVVEAERQIGNVAENAVVHRGGWDHDEALYRVMVAEIMDDGPPLRQPAFSGHGGKRHAVVRGVMDAADRRLRNLDLGLLRLDQHGGGRVPQNEAADASAVIHLEPVGHRLRSRGPARPGQPKRGGDREDGDMARCDHEGTKLTSDPCGKSPVPSGPAFSSCCPDA